MSRVTRFVLSIALVSLSGLAVLAQDKSVKPGINDSFRDPNPKEFQTRFEVESREVFARRREIVAACQIQPGQTVADIGAGTGLFTRMFSELVGQDGRVIAVDISQKFLDHIQSTCREAGQKNVETLLCKPDSTELPAGSIDVAFICDTYHHFEFPLKTMASIQQALRPGGRVILVDFRRVLGTSTDWVLSHVRAGQEVFESEVVQSGFRKTREPAGLLKENYFVEFTISTSPGLKPLEFPIIARFGGVVSVPNAAERPRPGAKVLFDVTADAKPGDVNKGLELRRPLAESIWHRWPQGIGRQDLGRLTRRSDQVCLEGGFLQAAIQRRTESESAAHPRAAEGGGRRFRVWSGLKLQRVSGVRRCRGSFCR